MMRPIFSESVSGMRHEDPNEAFERAMAEGGRGVGDQAWAMVGVLGLALFWVAALWVILHSAGCRVVPAPGVGFGM